jgi:hypothetical protein
MPMDVSPKPDGDFFMFRKPDHILAVHVKARKDIAERARQRGDKRYTSHFSTCPQADQHRKTRR